MFSLRSLFHVSFLAKLITVVWLLYTSSPHPKHFALHIAYTCQHSYFPVKVQLTLKDCLKPTLMCFIKWNLGCGGRSPGRSRLTSETSATSSWSWNKQIGGLLCSCKLGAAHFSKSTLQGVYTRKPHTQESWPPSGFSFAEWEGQVLQDFTDTPLMARKSYSCLCEENKAGKLYVHYHLCVCFTCPPACTVRLNEMTGTVKGHLLWGFWSSFGLRAVAFHKTLLVKSVSISCELGWPGKGFYKCHPYKMNLASYIQPELVQPLSP